MGSHCASGLVHCPEAFPVTCMRCDLVIVSLLLTSALPRAVGASATPDFNRDIRPILSDKCFRCHGPDDQERKGGQEGLRLDTAAGAREDLGGGAFAVVPGKPEKSELIARVTTTDEDEVMPPRKTGKSLAPHEIDVLRRWIAGGASYSQHWSYEKPKIAPPPAVRDPTWSRGVVDQFILARLEQEKLRPQPEADRAALARRVALDLTGLPPSLEDVDAFLRDASATAYERFVDAQLAKPAFGEHWARAWLDLARYADSKGYADDQPRSIWKYRDYVIDAFNRNVPFDQFTIEQLAGDLLPNPTQSQLFATGFHRNTMNNTEGGTDDEEFRAAAVVDRVNTTMAVWMGTSIACAQCHTHKYDPLTHKEYFQLYAIFNQSEDADRNDETPILEFYTEAQQKQRRDWESEIAALSRKIQDAKPAHVAAAEKWARDFPARVDWQFAKPGVVKSARKAGVTVGDDGRILVAPGKEKDTYTIEIAPPANAPVTALRVESIPHESLPAKGAGGTSDGNFVVTRVRAAIKSAEPFRRARYVRVELPGKARVLQLAEVQVMSGGANVAASGVASQSSTADGATANRATDGRTDGDYTKHSVTQTESGDDPWWEIDLGATMPVERVMVWGRTGAEATPGGLRVTALDENRQPVWEQTNRAAPNPSRAFVLSDPVELKLAKAVADYSQPDLEETLVISDAEPRARNARKMQAMKRGWGVAGATLEPHSLSVQPEKPIVLKTGESIVVTIEQQSDASKATLNHFRIGTTTDPRVKELFATPVEEFALLQKPAEARSKKENERLLDYYVREIAPELTTERKRIASANKSLEDMPINSSPILRELPADKLRKTHVQLRGNFLALGDEVQPGVPAVFPPLPPGVSANRLTLARWLVSAENPLTARVLANRLWESIFGIGLVRTTEEFGSQGEPPTHPELLDWLAVELVRTKWDTKKFLKMLVTSAAYRQSSKVTPEALAADPENRLLSRGPRFRLSAEMVRDQALAVSGLLSSKTHGPSARPYQPAFDLKAAFGSALDWKPSEGEDRFRRGLYTEWRRSSPYPSMVTFDAPNREVCTLRRNRSNTPLQALVTLNDPVYVEAAQALARRIAAVEGSIDDSARAGFRRVLARPPTAAELKHVVGLYQNALANYEKKPEAAVALISNAENPSPTTSAPAELAAWTAVANVLLNLDETLMKR
jgi:hypothetical protein